jgi:hypothetical protein
MSPKNTVLFTPVLAASVIRADFKPSLGWRAPTTELHGQSYGCAGAALTRDCVLLASVAHIRDVVSCRAYAVPFRAYGCPWQLLHHLVWQSHSE